MTISSLSAARTLCHFRNWQMTNLGLNKVLYIAHMLHLGERGEPLVDETFEAWDYGPVLPSVYRAARGYGADPIQDVFGHSPYAAEGTPEIATLRQAAQLPLQYTPAQLVGITHWKEGAWAKYYRPGIAHVGIPNAAIRDEFFKRSAVSSRAVASA